MSAPGGLTKSSPGQTDRVTAALAKVTANAVAALPEPIITLPTDEFGGLTVEDARHLTDDIKVDAEALWDKLARAYTERAWAALGYESWDAYWAGEFQSLRLRLPREERQAVVCSLREAGLPIRTIASTVGISDQTVQKDIKTGRSDSLRPAAEPDEPIDVEVVEDCPDGNPTDSVPRPSPMEKKAQQRTHNKVLTPLRAAARDIPTLVSRVQALADDEEFRAWFVESDSRGTDVRREIAKAIRALEELRDRLP